MSRIGSYFTEIDLYSWEQLPKLEDMAKEDQKTGIGASFWTAVSEALDPAVYKPHRIERVETARLKTEDIPYYVIKQPEAKTYIRLSEADYALWWQMNGTKTVKDLLFYNLKRYRTLPIGHLNSLVASMREGAFLQDPPTNIYRQLDDEIQARNPASRGERILKGFLHTEITIEGLDPIFSSVYKWSKWLFTRPIQYILLAIIIIGAGLYAQLFVSQTYRLINSGFSVITFILANVIVIFIHELAHGLTVKHVGRELNRGGFIIYWGMPACFVDTRDTWLSTNEERMKVTWAGPHSGLIVGGLVGIFLTGVTFLSAGFGGETAVLRLNTPLLTSFIFQIGFVAYFSVFVNINPLLELDGYFILMDWMDIPGLRQRAFHFWHENVFAAWQNLQHPRQFWAELSRNQRIFMAYGAMAFIYSIYALGFALYFWRSRLTPLISILWHEYGWGGRILLLIIITAVVVPTVYYLLHYSWSRIHAGLEWLARRDLLIRVDVLALLIGLPLLVGIPAIMIALWVFALPYSDLLTNTIIWFVFLTTIITMINSARQLPGSRFQWSIWSLTIAFSCITIAWISHHQFPLIEGAALIAAAGSVLAASIISWLTIQPEHLEMRERLLMASFFFLGMVVLVGTLYFGNGNWLVTILILMGIIPGLIFLTPLFFNFWQSRFALPWLLLVIAIFLIPWLQFFPLLYVPMSILWLYAAALNMLLGVLTQFSRIDALSKAEISFSERERLVDAFNHFMQAFFLSYEAVFGKRRLHMIYHEILTSGAIDTDGDILTLARQCQRGLLLAVNRLDDLAGEPFTRQAGQAAYDSLPWLEAETLGRHVLAEVEWGVQLAQGFIRERDHRRELIRRADIFAGFDQDGIDEVLAIAREWNGRSQSTIARDGHEAHAFYLVESGKIGVFHKGQQMAAIEAGGYIGAMALLDQGSYMATYKTLTPVTALVIDRSRFDPLLRADTTLASQVSSGAKSRQLLKQMPLFNSLSPQQLAVIDAKLTSKKIKAGTIVVKAGEPRSHLFIVANGRFTVLNPSNQIIGTLSAGEHFGEYALFADVPYTATLRAETDSTLLLLDEPTFDNLVAEYERMSHYVEQIGSGRLLANRQRGGVTAVIS